MKRSWFILSAFVIISMLAIHASADTIILKPDGDSSICQLSTHGSTDHWKNVDDDTNGDFDYNYDDVIGAAQEDDYLCEGVPVGQTGVINGVEIKIYAKHDDAASNSEIHVGIKRGGWYFHGTDVTFLTSSYNYYSYTWDTDPADGDAWEWTDLQSNLGVGVKPYIGLGGTGEIHISSVMIVVHYASNAPSVSNPSPPDSSTVFSQSVPLSVDVTDINGDVVNVTFFNASDDSIIDSALGNNDTVLVSWDGLSDGNYNWYVTANDSINIVTSLTWSFTVNVSSGYSGFSSDFSWTTASIVIVTAGVLGGLGAYSYKRSK